MKKKKIDAHLIAIMGILIGLIVVLSNILAIETQFLKFSFAFVPKILMGMLFGPFWSAVGSVIADLIGNTLFAKAPFFIGFTLNKIIEGLIYGHFFYQKKVTWKNAFWSTLTLTLIINLGLTPLWLALMYHVPLNSWVIWGPRLIKALIMLPIQTGLVYMIGNALPLKRLGVKQI